MNALIKRRYTVGELSVSSTLSLRRGHIYARESLDSIRDAASLIDSAQKAAHGIEEEARVRCEEQIARDTHAAHEEVWNSVARFKAGFDEVQATFLSEAEASLKRVVDKLLDRLCIQLEPREKIASAIRMTLQECMDVQVAVMSLSMSDRDCIPEGILDNKEWKVEFSDLIHAGECRLRAGTLEWKTSLFHAVNALREPFSSN